MQGTETGRCKSPERCPFCCKPPDSYRQPGQALHSGFHVVLQDLPHLKRWGFFRVRGARKDTESLRERIGQAQGRIDRREKGSVS